MFEFLIIQNYDSFSFTRKRASVIEIICGLRSDVLYHYNNRCFVRRDYFDTNQRSTKSIIKMHKKRH